MILVVLSPLVERYQNTKPSDMKKLFATIAITLTLYTSQAQSNTSIESVSDKEQIATPKVKVFPNPATNVINVLGLLNSTRAQITISDMYGKMILTHEWEIRNNALNIPISNLETGIYMIVIKSEEQEVKTKFYKQ